MFLQEISTPHNMVRRGLKETTPRETIALTKSRKLACLMSSVRSTENLSIKDDNLLSRTLVGNPS